MPKGRRIKWDEGASAAENARRELPGLVSGYFAEVRATLAKDVAPRKLHRLRLASKQVRYTVELFRSCYPAGLEERLDAMKKLQDCLGDVNDAVAAGDLLRGRLKGQPKLRKYLGDRAAEKAAEFRREWQEAFDVQGREAWWTDFLARHARAPRRSKI